jgi:hypothetical protein
VTTQLRLVDAPEPRRTGARARARTTTARRSDGPSRSSRAVRSGRTGRRSATWGDWRLDASTRRVGRAGVAEARRALEAAIEQQLSRAS